MDNLHQEADQLTSCRAARFSFGLNLIELGHHGRKRLVFGSLETKTLKVYKLQRIWADISKSSKIVTQKPKRESKICLPDNLKTTFNGETESVLALIR